MPSLKHAYTTTLAAICMLLSSGISAQDLNAPIPADPALIKGKLANGLTYYIRPNATPQHKVELRLIVKAGSILEDDDQQGLAHFIEHMNFNGTTHFPKNELVNYLETIGLKFGADLNANTGFDKTVYELSIPTDRPDNLEKGFQVIEDWAHNALLTDKDIDEERGVILEESRLDKGSGQRAREQYFPLLLSGSRYASRMPIGKDSIIAHVSHEALRRYYHDWYRPDLMAVIVIGDMDTTAAMQLIQSHFGALINPTPERPHFYADLPPRTETGGIVIKDNEETSSRLEISYPYLRVKEESVVNDYRDNLKEHLLLELLRSRLRDIFGSSKQIADVFFDTEVHGYKSLFVYTPFGTKGPDGNITAITRVIQQAAHYGFYQSEIDMQKKEMISGDEKLYNERDKKNSSRYMSEYIRNFMNGEKIEGAANEHTLQEQLLPMITNGELTDLLKSWVGDDNVFTFITAPDIKGVRLPDNDDLVNMVTAGLHQRVYPMREKTVQESLLKEIPDGGKVVIRKEEPSLGAATYILSNGIEVTIKKTAFKNDEILLSGVKKGGECSYDSTDRMDCHFADELVPGMGYGNLLPSDVTKLLNGKNVAVRVDIGGTDDHVRGSCGVQDLETMLQLVYLEITSPRKDQAGFMSWRMNFKKQIDNFYIKPETYFTDTLYSTLYNDNALFVSYPSSDDIKRLRLNNMLEIYKDKFSNADGYHFFITGNVDTAVMLPLLETYLGGLQVSGVVPVYKDDGLRPISGVNKLVVHKGKANKSVIIVKYYGDAPYSEELERNMEALTDILNIKLLQDLREKMSDIYTGQFSGYLTDQPYAHYSINLDLPCGPEHVDELLAAVKKEITSIKENGPTPEDVQKIKTQWHEKYKSELTDNSFWLGEMEELLYSHKSEQNFINYPAFIDRMTAADIQAAAKQLFDGKNELTGVLMPE